ncbi:MAG: acyl dehydratase [Chloroflexi bacterium]|nr:acyl dehydratase [Chloroflexota bacterium]
MSHQIYFEDVQEGMDLPPVAKQPTPRQLVKYGSAAYDFYEIHYNDAFAKQKDLPGIIVHGALKNAFLGQLVTDWMGEWGNLKKLSCQYRGMDVPGDTLTAKGKVSKKEVKDGENLAHLEIWIENGKGEKTTPGQAVVSLPSKNAPVRSSF